jgi:hypothetical protein
MPVFKLYEEFINEDESTDLPEIGEEKLRSILKLASETPAKTSDSSQGIKYNTIFKKEDIVKYLKAIKSIQVILNAGLNNFAQYVEPNDAMKLQIKRTGLYTLDELKNMKLSLVSIPEAWQDFQLAMSFSATISEYDYDKLKQWWLNMVKQVKDFRPERIKKQTS